MIKTKALYFDTAATTPLDLRVADNMHEINKDIFGTPSSIHQVGQKSHNVIERSRKNEECLKLNIIYLFNAENPP